MDSNPIAKHEVILTPKSVEQLKLLSQEVIDKLYLNFIVPIQNGVIPPHELQGKYKPSWEMTFIGSPMKDAFLVLAREKSLYHYHFGYRFYVDGKDLKYPGAVSDGIIHTQVNCMDKLVVHSVLEINLEHPSPFRIPFLSV